MKKRILSLALALCMMLSIMPTSYAGDGFLTLGDSDVQQETPAVDTPIKNEEPSLTLGGVDDSGEDVLSPNGFETEDREEAPVQGVLTLDDPQEKPNTPVVQQPAEEPEQSEGVLFIQCDFCGYLDGNHADDCVTQKPEEPEVLPLAVKKASPVVSNTYQDIYDEMMAAESLDEFNSALNELDEDQQAELLDLLSKEEQDALNEQEDTLAKAAVSDFEKKETTKKTVTVERRAAAFGAAQREALRQLGYELIVDMFGWIVDAIDLPQNDYTVMEAVSPEVSADYQWQILVDDDLWVDIYNETSSTIRVSYAMVANLLDRYDTVQVRCEISSEDGVSYTDPVEVCVDYTSEDVIIDAEQDPIILEETVVEEHFTEEPIVEEPIIEEPIVEEPVAQTFSVTRLGGTYAQPVTISLLNGTNGEAASAAETPELGEYSVVINYQFEDGLIVTEAYTATLAQGSNFSATVTFPVVQGYLAYWGEETSNSTSYTFDITNIQGDETYTVTYKPTNVEYTVIHYWQNVDNDNYVEHERETLQGLTKSTVPEVANAYDGFYALLYEKPAIAADGSTVVEVYYDRMYYLINFDLDGGYGVEPIYARYGAPVSVGTPTKAGYSFVEWDPALPETVPMDGGTYTAEWQADNTAKVTIVFWGENADDEDYSYVDSAEIYVAPGTAFTYSENAQLIICGKEEHEHSESCTASRTCGQEEHTAHTDACMDCEYADHEHSAICYISTDWRGNLETCSRSHTSNPKQGDTYSHSGRTCVYYNNRWYVYDDTLNSTTCASAGHAHTSSCYTCAGLHTHSDGCYTYSCGKTEHDHSNACYQTGAGLDSNLWTFVRSDTVTVVADGSTVVNVYYDRTTFTLTFKANGSTVKTINEKWGADIHNNFPIKNNNGSTYNWSVPNGCTTFVPERGLLSIDTMPAENITFNSSGTMSGATIWYYVEALPGTEDTREYNGKQFVLYKQVGVSTSVDLTYAEEFHDILGFTQYGSDPVFGSNGYADTEKNNYLYYTRDAYDIVFYNPTDLIHTEENIPYQANLESYEYTPSEDDVPEKYEPGSVEFGGWYLNPECSGDEFDFASHTMPLGPNNQNGEVALSLYAKWVPVTHTVTFYLDQTAYEASTELSTQNVTHGELADTVADPVNGSYTFIGWFYQENGVEKAFDFNQMAVTKDMDVYGKWSSNTLKEYTVYYKIEDTDTQIADPITGSGLAGATKTFDAKGGDDLYKDYREGFFPLVKSHSLTLNIEDETQNTFTFWYVHKGTVPYTVKYLNAETGDPVADEKVVSDNRKAVVTETFVPVQGYMPDAYQKRLVVDGTDGAENVIIFYYTQDTQHAYYKITHYTQNTDGESWTEYASSQAVGDIGTRYTGEPMTINGFRYEETEYMINGEVGADVTEEGAKLTDDGLEINLYYVRNEYPYQVRYLEYGTGKQLNKPKNGSGLYGDVISEIAEDIENYTVVGSASQTLNIRIEESQTEARLNIITFYYTENTATINYEVVGPADCGIVAPVSETVKVITGTAQGSTATASSSVYKFVGWYDNEACSGDPISTNPTYIPSQPERELNADGTVKVYGEWPQTTTFYAKFEYNLTDLTIKKTWTGDSVYYQDAIFTIAGDGLNLKVVIPAPASGKSGEITITGLTVGETYTVAEDGGWSWRYTATSASKVLEPVGNEVSFTNNLNSNVYWFDGSDHKKNKFGVKTN